jgi:hypothetical protein
VPELNYAANSLINLCRTSNYTWLSRIIEDNQIINHNVNRSISHWSLNDLMTKKFLGFWNEGSIQKTAPYRGFGRANGYGLFHRNFFGIFSVFRASYLVGSGGRLFIQLEPGSNSFGSLVEHSLVYRSLLYDRHLGGDASDGISDRQDDPQENIPIGNESRVHEFGFLGSSRLTMGSSPLFYDRIFDPRRLPDFDRPPSFSKMDQILSIP